MKYFLFLSGLLLCFQSFSQEVTQTVRGSVRSAVAKSPLKGANVVLSRESYNYNNGTVTDEEGRYRIDNVQAGRYKIQISFTGFRTYTDEVLVISGRAYVLDVALEESATMLSEVTFTAPSQESFDPTVTSISIEKTMRIPANFFDPVRMTTSYPGVVAMNDQANAIIVKGNSPFGLLWRLNGLDIVNPNHLSNAGTQADKPVANGGGVNILSAQMLDKTNFYTNAYPVPFGNVLSGVYDMNLRKGNQEKDEYTAQASVLGLDVSAEGPFNRNKKSSYLVNYRYSTIALLSNLGVEFGDELIAFQDLSFNLNFEGKNGRNFSVFGLGGNSSNEFEAKDADEVEEDKDNYDIDYDAMTYGAGLNYNARLGNHGSFFFAAGYSSSDQDRTATLKNMTSSVAAITFDDFSNKKSLLSTHTRFQFRPREKFEIAAGLIVNNQVEEISNDVNAGTFFITREGEVDSWIAQPYVNAKFDVAKAASLSVGARYFYFSYNEAGAFEPRISFDYAISERSSLNLAYRRTTQAQSSVIYVLNGNTNLDLTKSDQFDLGYSYSINDATIVKSEIYYQNLSGVPVSPNSTFSTLNLAEISYNLYMTGYATNLVNEGKGENYGINLTVEKSFYKNYYFIIGGSLYESNYTDYQGVKRDTRFNGNYTFSATSGKEWLKTEKKRTIGLNMRLLYLGGLRESDPINGLGNWGAPFYNEDDPFNNKLQDYFRIDLRLSFRKDKPGYTRMFAFDIQNVTSFQNESYHYYDGTQAKVVTKYQLGIIPVFVYRIDF